MAAKDAMSLIWRNAARFAVVASLGSIFIVVGKIFVCALTTFICYLILTETTYKDKIYSPFFTSGFIAILSYFVGLIFMSVYGNLLF